MRVTITESGNDTFRYEVKVGELDRSFIYGHQSGNMNLYSNR